MADKKVWTQVTLCRDCRFAEKIPEFRGTAYEEFVYCNLHNMRRKSNDYCSDSEFSDVMK